MHCYSARMIHVHDVCMYVCQGVVHDSSPGRSVHGWLCMCIILQSKRKGEREREDFLLSMWLCGLWYVTRMRVSLLIFS